MDDENHRMITGKNEGESCSSVYGYCNGQCRDRLECDSNGGYAFQCGKCIKRKL